jgi:hypothetical protein
MTVTEDHVRELLTAADSGRPVSLILLEGRAEVVATADLDTDRFRGALVLLSGADLAEEAGADGATRRDPADLAAALNAVAAQRGG